MRRTDPFYVATLLLSLVIQILGSFVLWLSYLLIADQALAAAPITSSGLNTQVSQPVALPSGQTQYNITGGTRPGGGTNLFHSFGDFNVPNNNIASFFNDSGLATSNILGRVTGGNISNIFGTIQTTGFGNANLFMMNPAGFLFGPNATINVGGMVAFTTTDYLRLADGILFNAIPNANADALLSAAPVAAFGFLGSNPGAIAIQGSQFSVADGTGISLVGGNITIQNGTLVNGTVQPARLSAPNGQINLATAKSPGEFLQDLTAAPNVNGASFTSFGSIHLAPGSTVDVSQTGNGKVSIQGGQFVLDVQNALLSTASTAASAAAAGQDNMLLSPGSKIITDTSTADRGPDVLIVADTIKMVGVPPLPKPPPKFATIQTTTEGSGDAGNITLTATQNIELTATMIHSFSQLADSPTAPVTSGNTGNISLTSTQGNISLTNFTQVGPQSIQSTGNVGNTTLSAPHGDILLDSAALFSHVEGPGEGLTPSGGSGGGIQITANNLTLGHSSAPPAGISIDNFDPLVPGNITVILSGKLSLDGKSFIQTTARGPALAAADLNIRAHDVIITGGSFLTTQTISSGQGGQLNISAENVQLTNGGQLRSNSISGPDFLTGDPTNPSGPGGTVAIHGLSGPAASVLIDGANSGIFTNAEGTGAAGNTNVAAQSLTIQNGGTISAATSGTASSATSGAITVNANQVLLNNGGLITAASTGPGAGGAITINSGGTFSSSAGTVSSTATQATGGDINITAGQSVSLSNGASISASSAGTGKAGNIQINAGNQFAMTNSFVTTEALHSSGGAIKITTTASGTVELSNSRISASVLDGTGGGGSVNIDPQFVLLQNSQILANAVQGPGGNISITTNVYLPDANSVVMASSQFGVNGTVTIQSPINPAGGRIIPLSQKPLTATALLSQRCAALAGGELSSFTVAGRDSLPAEPGGWLASPLALAVSEPSGSTLIEKGAQAHVDQPVRETPLLSLRQIAPPGFLTQAFAVDWSAGCTS